MEVHQTVALILLGLGALFSLLNWSARFISWRSDKFHSASPG
jgi:hypothetical protein